MPNTVTVTIELPERIFIRNIGGKAFNLETAKLSPAIIAGGFEVGAKTMFTNVFNGGGKDATEAERLAAITKKRDAWERGELNVVERGENQFTAMREAWTDEFRAATGASLKQADKFLADKVKDALGKDAKATFGNYLDITAAELVKAGQFENAADARDALEAHYGELAEEAAAKRAKVSAKLEAPEIDLSKFVKAKAKAKAA